MHSTIKSMLPIWCRFGDVVSSDASLKKRTELSKCSFQKHKVFVLKCYCIEWADMRKNSNSTEKSSSVDAHRNSAIENWCHTRLYFVPFFLNFVFDFWTTPYFLIKGTLFMNYLGLNFSSKFTRNELSWNQDTFETKTFWNQNIFETKTFWKPSRIVLCSFAEEVDCCFLIMSRRK